MIAVDGIREYVDANQSLPDEIVLGALAWYTTSDVIGYPAEVVAAAFLKHGFDSRFMPAPNAPDNAFEKATRAVATHGNARYPVTVNGQPATATILIRELTRTKYQIVRRLVREVVDSQNRKLEFTEIGELVYYKPATSGGKVDFSTARVRASLLPDVLTPEERNQINPLLDYFGERYDHFRGNYDGAKIRWVLRDLLRDMSGIPMKDTVWFVHNSHAAQMAAFQGFCKDIGVPVAFWQIPDVLSSREEVINAYQDQAEKELSAISQAVDTIFATRRTDPTPDSLLKVRAEFDQVMARAGEYGRTLQISQDRTAGAAELALASIRRLERAVARGIGLGGDDDG